VKYNLVCETETDDITIKINADCEEDAEAIALTKYKIRSVKTIMPMGKEKSNKLTYDPMERKDYPYIKNTGKSTVRIFT
jgi:hypothetical protein